jgi:hypothetical protein
LTTTLQCIILRKLQFSGLSKKERKMHQIGIPIIFVGLALVVAAGLLALLNSARSLMNLFALSGLRTIREGFFATKVGVNVVVITGAMLLIAGIVAVI